VLMYFDFRTWFRMLRLSRQEEPKARRTIRIALLVVVPLVATFNAVCFALDSILFPRLRDVKVRAPVFIVGHARSGTTLLHRLMCMDGDRFSYFLFYEMFFPSVLQKKMIRALGRLDRRVGGPLEKRLKAWDDRQFEATKDQHAMSLFKPEEDDFVYTLSCASGFWIVFLPYMDKLDFYSIDEWPARRRRRHMRHYEECVRRQLYLNGAGKVHLSKNPTFSGRVESLIEAFPDARIVVPVRNPYDTIPSLLKLLQSSWRARGWDDARMAGSLAALAEQSFHTYRYPLDVLERHPDTPQAVVDYRDLVADPKGTVEAVYKQLGLPVSPELTEALAARQSREAGHEGGAGTRYSLEEFGLRKDEIRTQLADLYARFGWDDEEGAVTS
jgi:omega-hydroxy-beta-dihydromenaquinone-9 sulfotransferase